MIIIISLSNTRLGYVAIGRVKPLLYKYLSNGSSKELTKTRKVWMVKATFKGLDIQCREKTEQARILEVCSIG